MPRLLKLKNSSLRTSMSGSILREPKTFLAKSIMFQLIFKSISTISLLVPDSGKGTPKRQGLTNLPNASALVLNPSLPSFLLSQIPMPPTATFMLQQNAREVSPYPRADLLLLTWSCSPIQHSKCDNSGKWKSTWHIWEPWRSLQQSWSWYLLQHFVPVRRSGLLSSDTL